MPSFIDRGDDQQSCYKSSSKLIARGNKAFVYRVQTLGINLTVTVRSLTALVAPLVTPILRCFMNFANEPPSPFVSGYRVGAVCVPSRPFQSLDACRVSA